MKETIIKIMCDICSSEKSVVSNRLSVIFTTEQTEGRGCEPYFVLQDIDICNKCIEKALSGLQIFAHGAQGHNTFYFKK